MDKRCERYQALIPLLLAGKLGAELREGLEAHTRSCDVCGGDLEGLRLTFAHVRERLTDRDPAFAAIGPRRPAETGAPGKRGEVVPFPIASRKSIRSRKFGYWAFRAAAMGIALLSALAGLGTFQGGDLHEAQRFQVASRAPLPMSGYFDQAVDYDMPWAYGLGLPMAAAPSSATPRNEVTAGYGLARIAYLTPLYEPPRNYGISR